jgi:hypothetical protein
MKRSMVVGIFMSLTRNGIRATAFLTPPVTRQLALGSSCHLQSYPARADACFWEHEPAMVADTIGPLVGGQIVGNVLAGGCGYCCC